MKYLSEQNNNYEWNLNGLHNIYNDIEEKNAILFFPQALEQMIEKFRDDNDNLIDEIVTILKDFGK